MAEFIVKKQIQPTVLKDATGFRTWRETMTRWMEIHQPGMNQVLKQIAKGEMLEEEEEVKKHLGKEIESGEKFEELNKAVLMHFSSEAQAS